MLPQAQLRKAPNGDCLRACIATLLEYKIENVPDFTEAEEIPGSDFPGWWVALQSWLSERSLFFLEMHLTEKTPLMPLPFPALCIMFGETEKGVKHAVIGRLDKNLLLPVFNPWPEAQIQGVGALGFLIPRDPAVMIKMGKGIEKIGKLSLGLPSGPIVHDIRLEVANALGLDTVNGKSIITATLDGIGQG